MVLFNVSPFESGASGFIFFYLTLFCALFGSIAMISFFVHRLFSRTIQPMFRHVQQSFRDAWIVGLSLIALLFLQAQGILRLWNVTILLLALLFVTAFVATTRRAQRPHSDDSFL